MCEITDPADCLRQQRAFVSYRFIKGRQLRDKEAARPDR